MTGSATAVDGGYQISIVQLTLAVSQSFAVNEGLDSLRGLPVEIGGVCRCSSANSTNLGDLTCHYQFWRDKDAANLSGYYSKCN
jgi:hypothetical protein